MRRVIVGVTRTLLPAAILIVGCQPADVEVVKLLPEPPTYTLPPSPPIVEKEPVKVAQPPAPRTWLEGEPGWVPPGGFSKRWTCIVIHHSATGSGCASEFHHAHQARGWDELGYHFVIGNGTGSGNGQIEVGPRWYKQKHGAHCKTAENYHNEHGIGICLVGDFERTRPTARQIASLNKLLRFLMANCSISADRVIGHREAPGAQTACPGQNVSMARIRSTARNLLAQSP
ncbi:MAG: N-acetylmuramoyl-L-alanine amidase [Phycisphaerae bacterium]|nr:N-acetylmuramoyl-L-alanine amidase [Phycisphaerae bacterium]